MTISTTTNRVSFAGNGTTTAFATDYKFFADGDLTVILVVDSTGVETTKALTTHYTVAGEGGATGGTVTMVTAPASGETLVIVRAQALTQGLDLVENDPFPSNSVEDQLDKIVIMAQQNNDKVSRSFKLSDGDTTGVDPTIPTPVALKGFRWNAGLTALEEADDPAVAVAAAAASAAAAAASAVSAAAAADVTPVSENFTSVTHYTAGTTTALTLLAEMVDEDYIQITFDGITQHHNTFSIAGAPTVITFDTAIPTGTNNVEVLYGIQTVGASLNNIVEDTTPQLGGTLDLNGFAITGLVIGTDVQAELTNAVDALTTAEVSQLANIGTSAISATEWGYVADATAAFTSTLSSEITANTAKVTNATHTGDVTGGTALTIAAGAIDIAMHSATGTPSGTTYLRGDNTWSTAAGGGVTDLTTTSAPTTVTINSSSGTNAAIAAADVTNAGVMTKAMFDAHVLNNAKITNAAHTGDVTGSGALTIAAGAIDIAMHSATGTPSGTTYLRGDNTWATSAGGVSAATLAASSGSSLVGHISTGTGSVAQTVQTKLRENMSVKDFGAVGDGATDDTTAVNSAIAAITKGRVIFPPGDYIITIASLVFSNKSISFDLSSGATINGTSVDLDDKSVAAEYRNVTPGGTGYNFHSIRASDNITSSNPGKVDAVSIVHNFGGSATAGGRHALESTAVLTAATSATNPDRHYVGVVGVGIANVSDGGALPGTPLGAVFGMNAVGRLVASATGFNNVCGIEVNVGMQTGATANYRSGIQITGEAGNVEQGAIHDAMLALSNQSGTQWKTGILFGAMNGYHPVESAGTLIETTGSATVVSGIDLSSYAFSSNAIKTPGFTVSPTGSLTLNALNAGIDVGGTGGTNTPFIDFHSSANAIDFDSRIVASGGSASNGTGALNFNATGGASFDGPLVTTSTFEGTGWVGRDGSGGTSNGSLTNIDWNGTGADLWIDSSNVGVITTSSDYRIKQNILTQTDTALDRIAQIRPVTYEFTDYGDLFKADGIVREGFVAHEVQAIIPSAVHGEKDAINQIQSLKLDALCSVMVKAIQEQQAQIIDLTSRLEALETP